LNLRPLRPEAIDPTGGRAQTCRPVRCRCPWTSLPPCPCATRLSLSSTRSHIVERSPASGGPRSEGDRGSLPPPPCKHRLLGLYYKIVAYLHRVAWRGIDILGSFYGWYCGRRFLCIAAREQAEQARSGCALCSSVSQQKLRVQSVLLTPIDVSTSVFQSFNATCD